MEIYTAIKENGLLIHATTWINLKKHYMSERSQLQKSTQCMIPLR